MNKFKSLKEFEPTNVVENLELPLFMVYMGVPLKKVKTQDLERLLHSFLSQNVGRGNKPSAMDRERWMDLDEGELKELSKDWIERQDYSELDEVWELFKKYELALVDELNKRLHDTI